MTRISFERRDDRILCKQIPWSAFFDNDWRSHFGIGMNGTQSINLGKGEKEKEKNDRSHESSTGNTWWAIGLLSDTALKHRCGTVPDSHRISPWPGELFS